MSSVFGNNQNASGGGGGLFGSNANQSSGGGAGGLFGSSTTQNQPSGGGGGLFGSTTNQQSSNTAGGIFGSNVNQSGSAGGGGLFGSNTAQTGNSGGALFGSSTTQNKPVTGGLFGSTSNQATGGGGLFGSGTAHNAPGNTGSGGLFGSSTAQPNNTGTGGGLFGSALNQNQNAGGQTSIFASNQNAPSQQQQTPLGSNSIFGSNVLSRPDASQQNQPGQTQQMAGSSLFNPQAVSIGNFGHTMTEAQLQKLRFSGLSTVPNEKSVAEQIKTVVQKWNPHNDPGTPVTTVLKTYLYNAVPKEYAPFFYPNVADGEDEKSWEEALSQKPDPPKVDGQEVSNLAYVPILCKGFKALGERVETQAKIIQEMRTRLHEMNNSLTAVMDAHQQRITTKIATAKRQHQVLSQRCLRLAVKVQILRNRGYALDEAEEELRRTLQKLEKQVMDPGFLGRQDEIWARMAVLRERARWLEEEGKRLSAQVDEQNRQAANGTAGTGVPEEVLVKTRKILRDYDGQLQHLNKEMLDVQKEYEEWEQSQRQKR